MLLNDGADRPKLSGWSFWVQRHAIWVSIAASFLMGVWSVHLWLDQIFLTFVHEASHGLAAVLTGGTLVSLSIQPDGSGTAFTRGGFRPAILVAGYAGSCLSGAALLLAARSRGWERGVCFGLAGALGLVTLFYVRSWFGFAAGLLMATGFAWVGLRGAGWQLSLLLSFLAVRSLLNSMQDLVTLVRQAQGPQVTDAALLSQELTRGLVPPVVFAVLIAGFSLVCLAAVARWVWARPEAL